MGDKGHFIISILKSFVRIGGSNVAFAFALAHDLTKGMMVLAISLMIAEGLGIAEEFVDKRK